MYEGRSRRRLKYVKQVENKVEKFDFKLENKKENC